MRIGVVVGLIFALLGANSPLISAQSTGNYQKTLQMGHKYSQTVDWNFDGSMLAVGSEGEVRLYSDDLQELNFIEIQGKVFSVGWNSSENQLAIAVINFSDATSSIYIWDSSNATLTQTVVMNETTSQFLLEWSPDNTIIATSGGGNVQLRDVQTGQETPLADATGLSEINSLDWSASSDFLVATNERGISYIWDTSTDVVKYPIIEDKILERIWQQKQRVAS